MSLRLYNTLTRTKEDFAPLDQANVRFYVCGPTVYDRAHIGNARPLIVFDVLYRLLRHLYGADHVTYVRNITDVDDKINARAAERGVPIRELTEETTRVFHEDVAALGCLPPDVEPRATDHIAEMKDLIERLVAREIAYVAQDHVLFSVAAMDARGKLPRYGTLSRRSLDELIAGARVEVAPYKRAPTDFVLWKPSKPGDPAWDSPCGITAPGRPGWHIECSAMSYKHLVEAFAGKIVCAPEYANAFDIHGGGLDLIFPHHENEIAQTCCALDTSVMAKVWMHNGFLQVEGRKMAKSAGNFVTIRDLLTRWAGDVLRLNMFKTHYRQPIDWTRDGLIAASIELLNWADVVTNAFGENVDLNNVPGQVDKGVVAALLDDLNTPVTLNELRSLFERSVRKAELANFVR
ncbi:MAG TPA: cysteine--tRNA ligase, partial [Beijerinckiaceae bacterium]|nr:cysteine--tRNA ligase [Beijerinckiaceae bacterium]